MENLAIIDMGSNSIRFIVIQIHQNRSYSLQYQQKESIRLGEGLTQTNRLSKDGMERAMTCLKVYAHMIKVMQVHTCIAVATAAVRNAKNGQAFIDRIQKETGIAIEVISGIKEAYLGYLGVVNTIDMTNFIQFDLGGASVEISLVHDRKIQQSVSVPIGAVTLTEKFKLQNTVAPEILETCLQYINKELNQLSWLKNNNLPVIGIGGTVRNLAKIDQRATSYQLPRLHNYSLTLQRFDDIYHSLISKSYANRKKIAGLSSERADIIIAGAAVIKSLLDHNGGQELIISGCGLREGLFFEYYGKKYGAGQPFVENILAFSTQKFLGTLHNVNHDHIDQVSRLTLSLFDQLQPLHGYGDRERLLLLTAAQLHDVGKIINYYDHARHSAFMIGHAPLYGMTQIEQITTSFIAGFHHGISNKIVRSYRYATLPSAEEWNMIRKLSTLLALAEASDVTYEGIIKKIDVSITDEVIVFILTTISGSNYDAADFEMKEFLKQFKKEYGRSLLLIWK